MNIMTEAADGEADHEPAGTAGRSRSKGEKVTVHYGEKQALFDVNLDVREQQVTALIGPSGCGKSTFLRCLNRMNDTIELPGHRQDHARRRGHLRSQDRRGGAARPRRHGVPEAQPVPQVDLRERRLRPAHPRPGEEQGGPRRDRRVQPEEGGAVERGQGPAAGARHRPVRRPAAAPVHRPRHRRVARGHPDGRAVLGARSDRHRQGRGADRRTPSRTTPSSSSPTPCSRRRACRSAPRCSISATWSRKARPTRCSPTPTTSARRTTSPAASAERVH